MWSREAIASASDSEDAGVKKARARAKAFLGLLGGTDLKNKAYVKTTGKLVKGGPGAKPSAWPQGGEL